MESERAVHRRIDRRQFLARAGFGAAALSLAGCGVDFSQQQSGSEGASEVSGEFSWRREEGKTITVGFAQHPLADSLIDQLPDFTEKTGIQVQYDTFPEEEFRQRLLTDLSTREGNYDAFMTSQVNVWQYAPPGWIEPLEPYLENPSLTNEGYDFDDFYPATVELVQWSNGELGQGNLWALPAAVETYVLHYRSDILEQAGITVPETFDELLAAAQELDGQSFDGQQISGFVARGDRTWSTVVTGYSTIFGAHGATQTTSDGTVAINSPEGVEATQKWADLMATGPDNIGTFTYYEASQSFGEGSAAFFLDADLFAGEFESEDSNIAGKNAYALPPAGPQGQATSYGGWNLGMSAASENKNAAWLFLQWATSKEVFEEHVLAGSLNPPRRSVAESNTMQRYTEDWGSYNSVWQENLSEYATWPFAASPNFPETGDRWALALQEIIADGRSVQGALDAAAEDITGIIEDGSG